VRTRLGAMLGVALALAACSTATTGGSAGARLLHLGQLKAASRPLSGLVVPADGRLIGPGFDITVRGAALADEVAGWEAGPAAELVAFSLEANTPVDAGHSDIAGSVSAGGTSAALPTPSGSGTAGYVMAAPRASDVVLHVSSRGVDQAFDLTQLHRAPTDPAVYYRNPEGTLPADVVSSSQTVMAQTASAGSYPITFSLGTETLDYLSPAGIPAAGPDQAWLVTDLSEAPSGPVAPGNFQPIPPSRITLSFPGGAAPVPALVATDSGPQDYNGLLAGTYYVPVPANLTAATLAIAGGSVGYADDLITFDSTATIGPTSFHLSFATAPPTVTPPGPSALALPPRSKVSSTTPLHRVSFAWLAAIVVGALAALAGGLFTRSRRRRSPGPPTPPAASTVDEPGPVPPNDQPPEPARPAAAHPPVVFPAKDSLAWSEPIATAPSPVPTVDLDRIAPEPVVQALLLGEPTWTGLVDPPSRCMELFHYLVTHPGRPWREDILSSALRPELEAKPISVNTIRDYASDLRRALPEGVLLPEAKETGGYRLSGSVGSDWDRFQALTDAARDKPDDQAEPLLEAAMALVRGKPFESVKTGTYGWADTEDLRSTMEKGIAGVAAALAGIRRRKGNLKEASQGLAQARLLVGISTELGEEMLRTAAEQSASDLGRAHRRVSEVLGDGLDHLYEELLAQQPWLRRGKDRGRDGP
jgi:hypothetical protein